MPIRKQRPSSARNQSMKFAPQSDSKASWVMEGRRGCGCHYRLLTPGPLPQLLGSGENTHDKGEKGGPRSTMGLKRKCSSNKQKGREPTEAGTGHTGPVSAKVPRKDGIRTVILGCRSPWRKALPRGVSALG